MEASAVYSPNSTGSASHLETVNEAVSGTIGVGIGRSDGRDERGQDSTSRGWMIFGHNRLWVGKS